MSGRVVKHQRRTNPNNQRQKLAVAEAIEKELHIDQSLTIKEWSPWAKTPLDPAQPYVRVLTLHRGDVDDPLRLDLQVVNLDKNLGYEALSYTWGDPNVTKPVSIDGVNFEVTTNLYNFLHCLRAVESDRIIWADAICIDQQSTAEKDHQIGLMGRIYRQAKEVHIWFGPASETWRQEIEIEGYVCFDRDNQEILHAAGETIVGLWPTHKKLGHTIATKDPSVCAGKKMQFRQVLDLVLETLDNLAQDKHLHKFPIFVYDETIVGEEFGDMAGVGFNEDWPITIDCLHWLLSRAWWNRVWTLQEASLPVIDPLVHIGSITFRLSRVTKACKALSSHVQMCCKEYRAAWLGEHDGHQRNLFINAAVIEGFRRELSQDEQKGISHEDAIRASLGRQVSVPRDRIFGILGLLRDSRDESSQQLSYATDEISLYCHFSKACYNASGLNTIWLAIEEDYKRKDSPLPSWAIDFGLTRELSGGADLLNSTTDYRWNLYNASLDSTHEKIETGLLRAETLAVRVVPVGIVRAMYESENKITHIIDGIAGMKRLYRDNGQYSDDKFWRTIFMDRNIKFYWRHRRRPLLYSRLSDIKRWWAKVEQTGNLDDIDPDYKTGFYGMTYHKRELQMNTQNTRFFCTDKGDPGIGHGYLKPLDKICVVAGSSSLAILRPVEGNRTDVSLKSYNFVGFCFVDGYMYGEALQEWPRPEWQTVYLV